MRTVRMTLGLLCCCPLVLLPVLLAQTATPAGHRHLAKEDLEKYDVFFPSASGPVWTYDHLQHYRHKRGARYARDVREDRAGDAGEDGARTDEVSYHVHAPLLFKEALVLQMIPVSDFISPGFVIQRVSGNNTWLEEGVSLECFYSGYVEGEEDSIVSLALCDGMKGVIHMRGEQYFIEPLTNSSSNSSSSSLPFHQRPHIIYPQQPAKNHSTSNCSVTENFKHHRLKPGGSPQAGEAEEQEEDVATSSSGRRTKFVVNNSKDTSGSAGRHGSAPHRQKRSAGVSRKHRVETMVVADNHMYQYHKGDLEHYVLTLMSIVRNIYKDPSLRNYVNIVVVKFIVFHDDEDMPFNVTYNAASTLRNFCNWQHEQNDPDHSSVKHHDTAILVTRKDICRAPGKCDTLGLAELGTVCDSLRSCSIIEDNGLSSAFTIAHELGHVFNLPHDDDDTQCKGYQAAPRGKRYHIMAPLLDANSSPWDWSSCSAQLMTEFIDAGHAECLRDAVKVVKWNNKVKAHQWPGWLYTADTQCEFIFGKGYGLCPFMNYPLCVRLWCTNKTDSTSSGCRTQHMPWADGTQCELSKYCQRGKCVPIPPAEPKPINGGWGSWSKYGDCSRTCGGGVRKKKRVCDSPPPSNGGRYCLGRRVQYKSCNTQNCPAGSKDFRIEQCAKFNGKVHINGLPPHSKWVPKYSGIQLKDACKLYCRASHSTAYYRLAKKAIDGSKCGPFTDDICVDGQCWRAGCDNKLGSKMKRDRCGVCGGDNYSCRSVTGTFNNAIYGYNFVTTIPAGATQLDIRQYGQMYSNHVDDDNYLAMQSQEKKFLLNGEFIVRTERWMIKVKGGVLEYSGSDHGVERINSTYMLGEPINLYVLSVGKLHPPNVTFSYIVSAGNNVRFKWSNMGSWRKCSHVCRGKRKRRIVCVREDDNLIVSKKRCKGKHLKKPHRIEEPCNLDCIVEWRVFSKEECPVRCGLGMRRQLVHCIKQTGYSQAEIIKDRECRRYHGAKPDEFVSCTGKCLPTFWSYTKWSECSASCGGGVRQRMAQCVDEEGRELDDSECVMEDKVDTVACNRHACPDWQVGDWLGCSVTCGGGRKHRKVWCMLGDDKVDDEQCNKKLKPIAKKECHMKECPEWYPGGWGPCSVTCGSGVSMRAVKCRVSTSLLSDAQCDATKRPADSKHCYLGPCPTTRPLTTTTTTTPAPRAAYWRFGSWTECSATCGQGTKHRFVSCTGYYDKSINSSYCAELSRPASVLSCMIKPCGDWRSGDWSGCTVTCGEGIQTRYVSCMFNEQITDESFCDTVYKPTTEISCNRGTCLSPEEGDFKTGVITSNRVEGSSRWLTSDWTPCSVTCGTGWQRRHVVCRDERGPSESCDKSLQPDKFQHCDPGPCPSWSTEDWSECSATSCNEEGRQDRLVYCRLGPGDILPNSNCDLLKRPPDTRQCEKPCTSSPSPSSNSNSNSISSSSTPNKYRWKASSWSSCSVTCGRGQQHREIICRDKANNSVGYDHCKSIKSKPRNTKRCSAGQCPKWKRGRWSRCSVTCGEGVKTRDVVCRDRKKEIISPALCPRQTQPRHIRACKRQDCSQFVWKVAPWSECSKTCGFGRKLRPVKCSDRQGLEVSSHLCDVKTKPKTRRRCAEFPCPYIWNTGAWSPCSTTCGEGQQMRTVVCQAVTKEGWILPGEVYDGCRPEDRPSFARYCNYGDCRSKYHWSVGDWGTCSTKCGTGREQRRVICLNRENQRVPSNHCLRLYRPPRHRQCYSGPCYARSCKELKELTTIRKDGDYKIEVNSQLVTIYCKDMRKPTPIEYLSLPAGEASNFAEVYNERLRRHATCPYNKTRPDNCDLCRTKRYSQAGNTTYSKVRIDLNTLRIFVNDGAFSFIHNGKFIPFGSAGDCYSSNSCPQGQFSINLIGTDFIVSVNSTWMLQGNSATQQIWRLMDGQIIRGLCGGYCGMCSPDHVTGLQLQLTG